MMLLEFLLLPDLVCACVKRNKLKFQNHAHLKIDFHIIFSSAAVTGGRIDSAVPCFGALDTFPHCWPTCGKCQHWRASSGNTTGGACKQGQQHYYGMRYNRVSLLHQKTYFPIAVYLWDESALFSCNGR